MPIGLLGALAIGSIAGGVASGAMGAHAAGKAADTQASAANQAALLQKQSADQALAFQKQEFDTQQKNMAPFLSAGTGAVNSLSRLLSTPGSGLLENFDQTFQAPTLDQAKQNPGYQFALDTGTEALDKSAAARGNVFSGTQGAALEQFGQNLGTQNYSDVYNRAMNEYLTKFNVFNSNNTNTYNRLLGLAGGGQTAATVLGTEGQQATQNSGNIVTGSAAQQGQDMNNAAAARASGYVGGANAWTGALSNAGNTAMQIPLYSMLMKNQGLNQIPTANPEWLQAGGL